MFLLLVVMSTLLVSVPYSSVGEWALHRYLMHRPVGKFRYPFVAHTLMHHAIFRADDTYHLKDHAIRHKITMAWWNAPAIVAVGGLPFWLTALGLAFAGMPDAALAVALTSVAVFFGNYVVYEYIHWCMHLPKDRRIERWKLFRRLNAHHLLHHRYMDNNLNVVLPLADWLFGTLLLKAKRPFLQARGPSVPDVQPVST
jgi:hypothetical protein